jgi:hypothetical protein
MSKDQARDLDDDIEFIELNYHAAPGAFYREAAKGWPYAIKRALEAEKEVDRLRNELSIMQDANQRIRGCWD